MAAAPAVKLVIAGGGTTVTVTGLRLVTCPTPLLTAPVPPENTAVNVVEFPAVMVAAPAVKLVIAGGGTAVTLSVAVPPMPISPARMVAVPVFTPVARPPLTVATDVLDEVQFAVAV